MIDILSTVLRDIDIQQVGISILGGFIFGTALFTCRPWTLYSVSTVTHYIKYVTMALVVFYITFPFAQGMLGYFEFQSLRLLEVTISYSLYLAGFLISAFAYESILRGRHGS